MEDSYLRLTAWQLVVAALLMLANGGMSLALRLELVREFFWASIRTVVQLLLLGMVLEWVFHLRRWYVVVALLMFMTVVAGITAVQRAPRRHAGLRGDTLLSIWLSSWLVTAFAVFGVLGRQDAWYDPQYVIPLLGMVLGNALNGISVGLQTFAESLSARREEVEMILTLGGTRWEAARQPVRNAVRTGLTPILNSMSVVGLVSLPGMMTGQILAGADPLEAVKYQIVIMFLVGTATCLGTALIVLLTFRRMLTPRHQLRIG